ncbi:MAG: DNA recombination protein RmuC [Minisyncoccia bacterium]
MSTPLLILSIISIIIFAIFMAIVLWYLKKLTSKPQDNQSLSLLQGQISDIHRTLDERLKDLNFVTRDITEKVTKLDDTNKQVIGFADQLQNLQNILQNSKLRGNLGEYQLSMVLSNALPPTAYKEQYEFQNGDAVDVAILYKKKIIPVDSKFPLENYNKLLSEKNETEKAKWDKAVSEDIKKRIEETSKYIRPKEGTTEFAFMFIPSEAIYYDILTDNVGALKSNTRSLVEYAMVEKHVYIVAPTTLWVYLQMVVQGLRDEKIENSFGDMQEKLRDLSSHLKGFEIYLKKLGEHLKTTVGAFNDAYKEMGKFGKDVRKITDLDIEITPEKIDKPKGLKEGDDDDDEEEEES